MPVQRTTHKRACVYKRERSQIIVGLCCHVNKYRPHEYISTFVDFYNL
jgi:hypothetical protein